jgi:hypothetical protein
MQREENVFLAKKLFSELVYNTAYIEGCNLTFPQTLTILQMGIIDSASVDDIQKVLNLRDAWKHLINTLDTSLNLDFICKLNEYVSRNESLNWGVLREGRVGISGSEYVPPVPEKKTFSREIYNIFDYNNTVSSSI